MLYPTPSVTDLGLDPAVAATLLPHIDSFAKWELVRFLHDNPGTEAGIEDLARYTGRDEMELKPAARALSAARILRQRDTQQGHQYGLTVDPQLAALIRQLVRGYVTDRLVRLAVASHILRAHRASSKFQYAS